MKHSGYVIYPEGSTRAMLRNARKEAARQSETDRNQYWARIELIDSQKTVARYHKGKVAQ